jgi:hypothetical protein
LNRKESKEKGKLKSQNKKEKNHALKQNEGEDLEVELVLAVEER